MADGVTVIENKKNAPKLRDLLKRVRRDSDDTNEPPILDFIYRDSDLLLQELAELYSYTEEEEFIVNAESFYEDFTKFESGKWIDLYDSRRKEYIYLLINKLEVISAKERKETARAFLYLAQGVFQECDSIEENMCMIIKNVNLLHECGIFPVIQQLLIMEADNTELIKAAGEKTSISITDSEDLRIYINILYTMIEAVRLDPDQTDDVLQIMESLKNDLGGINGIDDAHPFALSLFDMVLKFCAGSCPHFPIKKVLLLLWKVVILTLGGFQELQSIKFEARKAAGLPGSFEEQTKDAMERTPPHYRLAPASPVDEQELQMQLDGKRSVNSDISHQYMEKLLMLRPKVREKDVQQFLQSSRAKFVGYQLHNDCTSTAGLPQPIIEGLQVLKNHVYVSLAEIQIKREEDTTDRPFSKGKADLPETKAELLYKALLPNLPQYMIALLKILLASAPTAKAKTDSINILADVLPTEMPTTVLLSMQLGIDVNRHKEIMVKSISALILLLLKHFKVNHIYQFEFVSQHLVFANCIPLVLKFFNQNISAYVSATNTVQQLDFPRCVLEERHEITAENLESGNGESYCWRNLFSCINLLRILQKLTKWKHSRTMMLVVFKSAPILKRALKIQEEFLQLYVLKLLKTQIKYLGRNWRKSNMKTMSLIYHKVRHRLNDDWAFGNDLDARPWDFQTEECALRQNVDLFNYHHYEAVGSHYPADFHPVDNDLHSCLSQTVRLTPKFKKEYEKWIEKEVFNSSIDWNELLEK